MTTKLPTNRPWDSLEYQRIVSASYRGGAVIVEFADGSRVQLTPQERIPWNQTKPDWPKVRAEEFHIVVPTPSGQIEVPWDVIRVRSEPAFDTYWAKLAVDGGEVRVKSAS